MTWGVREGPWESSGSPFGFDKNLPQFGHVQCRCYTKYRGCKALNKTGPAHPRAFHRTPGKSPPSPPKGAVLEGAMY